MSTVGRLMKTLATAGKPAVRLALAEGAQALVLPHGGRVLGLYAADCAENFLWTNPALRTAKGTVALFASEEWCNTGGDRTWIAPENDFFRPDYPKNAQYFQPRQLDPGAYRCELKDGGARLSCDLVLRSYRMREDVRLRIVKRIEPTASPFHQIKDAPWVRALSFAGYTLRATLELRGKAKRSVAGMWSLLQMPHSGRMLVPVRSRTKPSLYFGTIPDGDLELGEHAIRYTMRGAGSHKIGVKALALTGRAGYLYRTGRVWALVVRNFAVNPSGTYADFLTDGTCPGDAFQACSVSDAVFGRFSELEYHVPAIGGATGLTCCTDASQVWAFRGSLTAIRRAAAALLGSGDVESVCEY
ncbi:MAG: hypothetical protein PHR35_05180 [Kiritimatiellae bacterium]|nr:hypothetical protein [Kiritimatiellia bacterium]